MSTVKIDSFYDVCDVYTSKLAKIIEMYALKKNDIT